MANITLSATLSHDLRETFEGLERRADNLTLQDWVEGKLQAIVDARREATQMAKLTALVREKKVSLADLLALAEAK